MSSARRSVTRESQRNRTRSSESHRGGKNKTNSCNDIEPIEEECNPSQINEDENDIILNQEPRYDAKELRETVRIISPFVKLLEDTKNPYARIVAREVCKTFYRLFHPGVHPADLIKSINWKFKLSRSRQLWDELWLYLPGGVIKDWVPLVKCPEENALIDSNDCCNPCQPQIPNCVNNVLNDIKNFSQQQQNKPVFINSRNFDGLTAEEIESIENDETYFEDDSNECSLRSVSPPHNLDSPESPDVTNHVCDSMDYNICGDISPSEINCDHQPAGSDSLSYINKPKSNVLTISPNFQSNKELIVTQPSDNKCQLDQLPEYANKKCFIVSEDTIRENDLQYCDIPYPNFTKRQTAGNDQVYLPYCRPGPSSDPPHYTDDPSQFEYYRITGNATTSRQNQDFGTPVEPGIRTNVLDNSPINDEECSDSDDSVESVKEVKELDMNQVACNASMVANAFTNLTLASNELKKKKEAFKKLTISYLNVSPKSTDGLNPPHENNSGAKMVLQTLCENPPKISPFDDHDWNDNAFKDRDFIRLLPFYESIHNELEYISKEQRDYGYNMLDDIMSTLYHIHYELGDPRLKNELLVDHIKLITGNTWEAYFYKGNKKMPAIPERYPPRLCSPEQPSPRQPSPRQSCLRQPSPRQPCPREPSPRQPCPREPSPRQPCPREPSPRQPCPRELNPRESCPKSTVQRRQSVLRRAPSSRGPNTATTNNKPQHRSTSSRRTADVPQQNDNPLPQTRNFLRRSRPSGAPKAWAPKLKPIDRPDNFKEFRAKPLPKFVRDRINSQDNDEQC